MKPGLRLKERVRKGEITVKEAMEILQEKEPTLYIQTQTWRWLTKHLEKGTVFVTLTKTPTTPAA